MERHGERTVVARVLPLPLSTFLAKPPRLRLLPLPPLLPLLLLNLRLQRLGLVDIAMLESELVRTET